MTDLDKVVVHFDPAQLFLLNICLGFLMFGVALDLRLDAFKTVFTQPKSVLVGLFSQLVILPVLTLGLVFLLNPGTSLALGMILVAVCPGGNVSNYAVHLAGANSALSVTMTSISTLSAIVVTPLYFGVLAQWMPGTAELPASLYVDPADMLRTIGQLILVPLAIGIALNTYRPIFTAKIKTPVRYLSMVIFLSFVVFAIAGNWENIKNYLHLIFFLVLVHNATALSAGYWFARISGLPLADVRAISIETGIQNSGLGLILIFNFFNGLGGMAMIAAWWSVWHLMSAFALASWWRRHPVASLEAH